MAHRQFIDIFKNHVENQNERILFRYLNINNDVVDSVTFQEIHIQASYLADYFLSIANFGDRAILIFKPGLDFAKNFLACLYAGIIAVPLAAPRPNRSNKKFNHIFQNCDPTLILTNISNLRDQLSEADIKHLKFIDSSALRYPSNSPNITHKINPQDAAFIQYTSGSTQLPKGVIITHENLTANSQIIYEAFCHSTKSSGVTWLPSFHDMGLIGGIIQPMFAGYSCDIMSPLNFFKKPINWLKAISEIQATSCGGHNNAFQHCVDRIKDDDLIKSNIDLSSWSIAFCGAEPISSITIKKFCDKFSKVGFNSASFHPCYGLAESTLFVTGKIKSKPPKILSIDRESLKKGVVQSCKNDNISQEIVSCGIAFRDTKIKLLEPQSQKEINTDNHIGEITVLGKSVSKGYWKNNKETKQTFPGYLKTGDLGFLCDGELYPIGRIKELIIVDGQNIYPHDIEHIVREKINTDGQTGEIAAFSSPDKQGKEKLIILIEHKEKNMNEDSKKNICKLILNVIINEFDIKVDAIFLAKKGSIPKTSSGKKQRILCQKLYNSDSDEMLFSQKIYPNKI